MEKTMNSKSSSCSSYSCVCVLYFDDWLNGGSVDVFSQGEYGFTHRESMPFTGMGIKFKDKNVLYCQTQVKCKQGFTTVV